MTKEIYEKKLNELLKKWEYARLTNIEMADFYKEQIDQLKADYHSQNKEVKYE